MTSRGQLVRDFMRGKTDPMSSASIAEALGLETLPVQHTIGNMFRSGILGRVGSGRKWRYFLERELVDRRADPEESRKRRQARGRIREDALRRARGCRTKAEYIAFLQEGKRLRLLATQERVAARKAAAKARVAGLKPKKPKAKPKPPCKPGPKPKALQITLARPFEKVEAPPAPRQPETIEQWMARTGRKPEVLPLGYVSRPLTFGGHRDLNDASMRQALAG